MKKMLIILLTLLSTLSLISCDRTNLKDEINIYLERLDIERYIEISVEILHESTYHSDGEQNIDTSRTAYIMQADTEEAYLSYVFSDFPENELITSNYVYERLNLDTYMFYRFDSDYFVLDSDERTLYNEVDNLAFTRNLMDEFIPNFLIIPDLEYSQLSNEKLSFNISSEQVNESYTQVLSLMYMVGNMFASQYYEFDYIFTYTLNSSSIIIEVEAYSEDDLYTNEVVATFEITFPDSISKINLSYPIE